MITFTRALVVFVCLLFYLEKASAATPEVALLDLVDQGRPSFRTITVNDGLPQATINAMAFDDKRYLWVGTQDGAGFYNGRKWTTINMPNRMQSNHVNTILPASDGSMWFGTLVGIHRKEGDRWTSYDANSGLPANPVFRIVEMRMKDGSNVIWAATAGGLCRFEKGQLAVFTTANSGLPHNFINYLTVSYADENRPALWVATNGGLARWQDGNWSVQRVSDGLPSNFVTSVMETIDDNNKPVLWALFNNFGAGRYEDGKWTLYGLNDGLPALQFSNVTNNLLAESRAADGERTIWVGTLNGLARFQRGRWFSYGPNMGLPHSWVISLIVGQSEQGAPTLWIGLSNGLASWALNQWTLIDRSVGIAENMVWSIVESKADDGSTSYWIGTGTGGISVWEKGRWRVFDDTSGLPNNQVRCLLESRDENGERVIWAGTATGLAKYQQGRWSVYNAANSGLPGNFIYSLKETIGSDGTRAIWVGTINGLARFEKGSVTVWNVQNGLPGNRVNAVVETRKKDGTRIFWIATSNGLAFIENDKVTAVASCPLVNLLGLNVINEPDGRPQLWVCSAGGLARRDLDNPDAPWKVLNDTTRPALPNNFIYNVREDAQKRLYVFTNKGVARLTRRVPDSANDAEFDLYVFNTSDGLPTLEFNAGAALLDSRGRIWGGTLQGAVIFDPSKEVLDRAPKPLLIERASIAGRERAQFGEPLSYNENNLSFEFSLLSYFREQDNLYCTQLVGYEPQPTDWTAMPSREFTNLSDGSYTFRVWGRDYAGNITGPVEIPFKIKPAPWRTWWAYTLYLLAIVGFGYGGVRLRLQALERSNRILEEKVVKRTEELKEKISLLDQARTETERKNEELAFKNDELARKNDELDKKNEELILSHRRAELIFSALSDVLPGTVLDGKYQLESKIGSGGFGTVYRGLHLGLQRPIAVKVFRPTSNNATAESLERFRLEGISSCRINHPNAVTVLDSGVTQGGIAYLVMELLEGHTLTDELKQFGRFSPARCAEIIVPLCEALAAAHAVGIVHRDIKPDNIFLHQNRDEEIIKVVDFGIAKLMGDNNSIQLQSLTGGGMVGTPTYMSPERLDNKPYDGRADVYSVGVMLYQMLTGRLPFFSNSEDGIWKLVVMHLTQEPQPLREIQADIPAEVERVVLHALAKNPEERPNIKELQQEFIAALGLAGAYRSGSFRAILGEVTVIDDCTQDVKDRNTGIITGDTKQSPGLIPLTEQLTMHMPKKIPSHG